METFRDTWVACQRCGQRFIFRVAEQRALYDRGRPVEPPALCESCRLRDPETGKLLGQVKWFSRRRGYGFIVRLDGEEIFFHRRNVCDDFAHYLRRGELVSFEERQTPKGPEALEVEVVGMEQFS